MEHQVGVFIKMLHAWRADANAEQNHAVLLLRLDRLAGGQQMAFEFGGIRQMSLRHSVRD
jgi:hypothetical protein